MTLIHGGDWAGFAAEYGQMPLDFSANVSPLGVPAGVQSAIAAAAAGADRYPDPLCRQLSSEIAAAESVPSSWVLCGNGAADLIWRLVASGRPARALVPAPAFAEYEAALSSVNCQVAHYFLKAETNFSVEEDFADNITPATKMVFLCEPNNPTGRTTPMPVLQHILERCAEAGAILVVDECFGAFLDDPETHTLKGRLAAFPNLVILKAFTKMYAMAGVRLGYALCSDAQLLERMRKAGPPWSVSSLAQAAGCAALREQHYVENVRILVQKERTFLQKGLVSLGLRVIPGEANYLLFQCSKLLLQPLRERGILLRSCSNYPGLDATWYRTAVRTRRENCRLLAALEEILA